MTNSDTLSRLAFRGEPLANPESIVISGEARFTMLTARLLRLEWAESGQFEDRSTYAFPTRRAEPPPFGTRTEAGWLLIDSGALQLRYRVGSGKFTSENLSIEFTLNGEPVTWRPSDPNPGNLRGTRRTLDECAGDAALEQGLLSRAGWALFDDSAKPCFADGWPAPRPDFDLQDWYFFGYGHDYKAALQEYTRFGGRIPLIPRFVLGNWWSRYWAYSDQDLKDLVGDFQKRGLPLDVLVIDMDWHTPDAWTGYTWNRQLFPDPQGFLKWVHDQGLRTTFNLHPAQGVQSFEEIYPRFAEAMGVDPATKEAILPRFTDPRFVKNYFELLHHPMEAQGVDFWWMDWQQGESSEMKGLDNLPWINHMHFHDSARRGLRAMLYSRWGGLGNHRYHIGFSGDTFVTWEALQFQPYLTATASNVCYGWWSHDLGGHMGGATRPELYARWLQYGMLSPAFRLHSTKDARAERRPWAYDAEVYRASQAAFELRAQLAPYLYTMARLASETSISLCRPLYYEAAEANDAYAARYNYYFGDQIIAAPLVFPADPANGMAHLDIWLPQGEWIDYQTKESYHGPGWVRVLGDLQRVPMLVKAGGILPLAPLAKNIDSAPKDQLILAVFPGQGQFRLYEDDGVSNAFEAGQYEWTEFRTQTAGDTWTVEIDAVEGCCEALPRARGYEIRLEGSQRPGNVTIDGEESAAWEYDPDILRTTIRVPRQAKSRALRVVAVAAPSLSALGEGHNRAVIRSDVARLLGAACPADPEDIAAILQLPAETPGRADAIARLGGPFVSFVEFSTPEEASQQLGRVIIAAPRQGEPFEAEIEFTLNRGGALSQHPLSMHSAGAAQIVETPFAFDGETQTTRWSARVSIPWKGGAILACFESAALFPTINAWRAVFFDTEKQPLPIAEAIDARGKPNPALEWQSFRQSSADIEASLCDPYGVWLTGLLKERLAAGEALAAYFCTKIHSPEARQASFMFARYCQAEVYLNGERIENAPAAETLYPTPPLQWDVQTTAPMWLRAGANTLLVLTRPAGENPHDGLPLWAFGGALLSADGRVMSGLKFS